MLLSVVDFQLWGEKKERNKAVIIIRNDCKHNSKFYNPSSFEFTLTMAQLEF